METIDFIKKCGFQNVELLLKHRKLTPLCNLHYNYNDKTAPGYLLLTFSSDYELNFLSQGVYQGNVIVYFEGEGTTLERNPENVQLVAFGQEKVVRTSGNFFARCRRFGLLTGAKYADDATVLMIYYHNDRWFCSSNKKVEAEKWSSERTYRELAEDIIGDFDENLDKNIIYTYGLIHPENYGVLNMVESGLKDRKEMILYHQRFNESGGWEEIEVDDSVRDVNDEILQVYDTRYEKNQYSRGLIFTIRNTNKRFLVDNDYFKRLFYLRMNKRTLEESYFSNIVIAYEEPKCQLLIYEFQQNFPNLDYEFLNQIFYRFIDSVFEIYKRFVNDNESWEKFAKNNLDDIPGIIGFVDQIILKRKFIEKIDHSSIVKELSSTFKIDEILNMCKNEQIEII